LLWQERKAAFSNGGRAEAVDVAGRVEEAGIHEFSESMANGAFGVGNLVSQYSSESQPIEILTQNGSGLNASSCVVLESIQDRISLFSLDVSRHVLIETAKRRNRPSPAIERDEPATPVFAQAANYRAGIALTLADNLTDERRRRCAT
jgi:hypothetical protein